MTLTLAGVAIGTFISLVLTATVHARGYGAPAPDMLTLAVVPGGLLAVVMLAAMLPTQKALRVSPTIALRVD